MVVHSTFASQYAFTPELALHVGVERESFLVQDDEIVPAAAEALLKLPQPRFGYELSACQLEDRVGPCQLAQLADELSHNDKLASEALNSLGLARLFLEVAPDTMPLNHFPAERYDKIVEVISRERLLAACQVTGTHIHIGMPDHETALRVYNKVIAHTDELCRIGDHSGGRRLQIYRIMATDCQPIAWDGWDHFESYATEHGFVNDPRSCWHLIRLSLHGTIEFRVFGSPVSNDEVVCWAKRCHSLCKEAL